MKYRLFHLHPIGLKTHASIVSVSLISLILILGVRAHSVARSHFLETRDLVKYDLNTQALLIRMEADMQTRDQAKRKLAITGDPQYSELIAEQDDSLALQGKELEANLRSIYPDLAQESLSSMAEIQRLKATLNVEREKKLRHAQEVAFGLLRLIGVALLLCVGVTSWLLYLFYRGLIEPLASLRTATAQLHDGNFGTRIESSQGVAELRELSQGFNEMAQRLGALEKSKADFLATVSHEIKNPLAALKEGLSFLTSQGENLSPAARSKGFGACLIATKRLEVMINNLLKLSRGEKGLFEFDISQKNLTDVIQCAIAEVRPLAEKRGMSIRSDVPEILQAAFNWDGMVQVFENLLLNAIKYGEDHSIIEVHAKETHRPLLTPVKGVLASPSAAVPHVEVAVVNSGKGISAGDSARIFERFYRASNAAKQKGLGIGLHVVKQIIDAHHGSIMASSDGGKTFMRLWIPGSYETQHMVGEIN